MENEVPDGSENEFPDRTGKEDRRNRMYAMRRAIMDYGIGFIIMGFGVFLLIAPKLGFSFSIDDLNRYLFSGLCLLYGAFRAYRGSKKDYFK
ncbi:MAG TPA: hypothetical protein VGN00_29435 [Puia sp.]|jgi:hypothetical protein